MIVPDDESSKANGFAALMPLYLSLYILLLAIFILLTTFSTPEEVRMKAVIGSLDSTFPSLQFGGQGSPLTPESDAAAIGQVSQNSLGDLFKQAVPLAEYRVLRRGRQMEVVLSAEEIFLPDVSEFRTASRSFLMRLAETLRPSSNEKLEMTIFARVRKKGGTPEKQGLATARAANLAQTLLLQGAPPDSLLVALENGDENKIRLEFRVLLDKKKEEDLKGREQ